MTRTGHAALHVLLLSLARLAAGQDVPAARGPAFYSAFSLPDVSGTLRFSLSASDRYILGYNASNTNSNYIGLSGSVAYLSSSPTNPFSIVYSGAYSPSTSGQPTEIISNLALSQVLTTEKWHFTVADRINYVPETPTDGLSGISGLGDGNVSPVTTGSDENQGILTTYAQRIANSVSATATRQLFGATSVSVNGSQSINRYLNEPGGSTTDSNSYNLSTGVQRRLDARTSAGLQYGYGGSSFSGSPVTTQSQSLIVHASRTLTRRASATGSIGPQRSSSSNSAVVPTHTSFQATASFSYAASFASLGVSYAHSTTNSGGLTLGAESTTVSASASKQFEQALNLSAHVGYGANSSLQPGALSTHSVSFGAQANRSLLRYFSMYVSYGASHQLSSGSAVSPLVLNGLSQTLAFGVTYSPAAIHLGH